MVTIAIKGKEIECIEFISECIIPVLSTHLKDRSQTLRAGENQDNSNQAQEDYPQDAP
jgi:hypothetical protein